MAAVPSHRVYAALADDVTWFFRTPELRFFHVATGATERSVALHQLTLSEGHAFNHSPFFVLQDAHLSIDPGWVARAERMGAIHAERRKLLADEGMELSTLPALVHGPSDIRTFVDQLLRCLKAQHGVSPLRGIVVVLAPAIVEHSDAFVASLLALGAEKALADVRWIVLELGDTLAKGLSRARPEAVLLARCEVDQLVYRREHLAAMAAAASAPANASAAQLSGGAGPKGVLSPDQREAARRSAIDSAALEKEVGAGSALAGASGLAIRHDILAAAVAIQEGDVTRAVKLQGNAVRACATLPRLACLLELTLATYLLQSGDTAAARTTFPIVAARSEEKGMFDLAALAFTAWGASLAVSGSRSDTREAVARYLRAGDLAKMASEPILVVESYCMAGQLCARMGDEEGAITAWKQGLAAACAAPPEVAALSSGPLVARTLAKFLQTHGSLSAASSLLDQADDMERGETRPAVAKRGAAPATSAGRSS